MVCGGLVPSLSTFNNLPFLLAMIGLVLTIVLMLLKVRGSILIGIVEQHLSLSCDFN